MKLTITRAALVAALARATRVVSKRNTIPILTHVLLEAEGTALDITATDLDMTIRVVAPAVVEIPGRIAAPGDLLHDLAKRLPESAQIAIELDVETQQLTVKSGRSRFRASILPAADFPVAPMMTDGQALEIAGADLARLIERTSPAMSTEETRFYLQGVYLHTVPAVDGALVLRAVATNGHLLSLAQAAIDDLPAFPPVIIPTRAVAELGKLAADHSRPLQLRISAARVEATIDDVVLTTKVIDAPFPDYERVIPRDLPIEAVAELDGLRAAIGRVALAGETSKGYGVRIRLELSEGRLDLKAADNSSGRSAEEEIPADYSGAPFQIAFASKYLLDMIGIVAGDTARMQFSAAAGAPAVFRSTVETPDLLVLMPQKG